MFVLGHVGIGRTIASAKSCHLPFLAFAVGAVLPDVIDKPLYYTRLFGLVTCTRTFGHTGLFLLAVVAWALWTRSPVARALALGAATHPILDGVLDLLSPDPSSTWMAFTWPFLNTHFYSYPFKTPLDQLKMIWKLPVMTCEIIGALLLWREFRARRRTTGASAQGPHS